MGNSNTDKAAQAIGSRTTLRLIPFTGGGIIFVYAWFWPEGYGHWLGTIVHAFRTAAGF